MSIHMKIEYLFFTDNLYVFKVIISFNSLFNEFYHYA
jgi:hypothetical protein